ncbi:IncI1 conjugal transfer prepilin peptidase PilU [Salmonella enterica subsp. enterica]|uniref:IncI1 conjugal transfer prepilin peptidase PilU n=1 Tax=Salmonella enterica I TaxID=59201 RepID=A0A380CDB6_SALET|nr:IncI1 conjugal transfer prepilin peptidase PilU [Salmonella enterica subsp. enterica]
MQTIVGISLSPVYILPLMFTFSIIGRTLLSEFVIFYLIRDISGIRHTLLFCQEYGYTV